MMITQELLESDLSDDREQVLHHRVGDKGSLPCCMKGEVQGVHMYGIMDSSADITIIGARRSRRWLLRLNTRDMWSSQPLSACIPFAYVSLLETSRWFHSSMLNYVSDLPASLFIPSG